jgi:hypothetical protein
VGSIPTSGTSIFIVLDSERSARWFRERFGGVAEILIAMSNEVQTANPVASSNPSTQINQFVGCAVHIDAIADARYIEDPPADLRPQDPDIGRPLHR